MSYMVPPLHVSGFTAPHIVGTITTNLIASPGVGFALRIVACTVGVNRTAGAANVEEQFISTGLLPVWRPGALSLPGTSVIDKTMPPPGFQLPENEGLDLTSQSNVAAGVTIYDVFYYIDSVA